eukprot:6191913-Pleurochrysis_carterae.AAC.2
MSPYLSENRRCSERLARLNTIALPCASAVCAAVNCFHAVCICTQRASIATFTSYAPTRLCHLLHVGSHWADVHA